MKKFISLILCFCILTIAFPALPASAADIVYSGSWLNDCPWSLDSDGVLIVSGTPGNAYNPTWFPWQNYNSEVKKIVVEEGWKTLYAHMFSTKYSATSVLLPETLQSIGTNAFKGCTKLKEITIPKSVISISNTAFDGCTALKTIYGYSGTAAESFATAKGYTFVPNADIILTADKSALTMPVGTEDTIAVSFLPVEASDKSLIWTSSDEGVATVVNGTVTAISEGNSIITVTSNADKSKSLSFNVMVFDKTVTDYGADGKAHWILDTDGTLTFYGKGKLENYSNSIAPSWSKYYPDSKVTSVVISEGITHIGNYMFHYANGNNIKSVSLPSTLESIGESAFSNTKISSVNFPTNLKKIDSSAFNSTYIETAVLPESLETLGNGVFGNTPLREISLPDSLKSIGVSAFQSTKLARVTIPSGITAIPSYCFSECTNLQSVVIPETVTTISDYAFQGCSKLYVKLPSGITSIGTNSSGRSSAFSGCKAVYVEDGTYAKTFMASKYPTITKVIDENTVRVSSVQLDNASLELDQDKTVTLTATVSPADATYPNIVWISSNASAATVENGVVKGYKKGVTDIYAVSPEGNISAVCTVTVKARGNCGDNLTWEYFDDGKLVISGSGDMNDYTMSATATPWSKYDVTDVVIEEGVTSIGAYAFYQNKALKTVTFSNSLKKTGTRAFAYCESLESIITRSGAQLEEIGELSFEKCSSLKTFVIPDSVTTIKSNAFGMCYNTEVKLESENSNFIIDEGFLITKDKKRMIANLGFNGEEYTVPEGVETVDAYVFYGCNKLKRLSYPKTLQRLGSGSLYGCTSLAEITVPFVGTSRDENRTRYSVFGTIFGTIGVSTGLEAPGLFVQRYAPNGNSTLLIGTYLPSTLKKITITDDETIPFGAFSGMTQLTSITLPDNARTIDGYAFYGAQGIKEINLPKTLESINAAAFYDCPKLTDVYYNGTESAWGRVSVDVQNISLSSATIHYSSDSLITPTPEITVSDIDGGKSIAISCNNKAKIYYTTDGTNPTTDSLLYSAPVQLKEAGTITVKAFAVASGCDISAVASAEVSVEQISSAVISVDASGLVSFENIPDGANVYYTTDLTTPDISSSIYTEPFTVPSGTTVNAITAKAGYAYSETVTYKYVENIVVPQIELKDAQRVSSSSAVFDATILNVEELGNIERSFVYYEKNNPAEKITVKADESFVVSVQNLKPQTEYCYEAIVLNGKVEGRSSVVEFTTNDKEVMQSISLPRAAIRMQKWRTKKISPKTMPENAIDEELVWSSSDKKVVNVSKNGELTANGEGTAIVTVATKDGYIKAECAVTVYNKYLAGEYDFSELNMATNVALPDESGLNITEKDGGNYLMALAYLARWDGAVFEETHPYPMDDRYDFNSYYWWDYPDEAHVQNAYVIERPFSDETGNVIKEALMRYGGLYTTFVYGDPEVAWKGSSHYFPIGENIEGVLHAVTIVGWDDTYPAEKFKVTPPGNGAFICKDSWGEDDHAAGFFYVSYYDAYFGKTAVAFPTVESVDNYNTIWQYDPYGMMQNTSAGSTTYAANVFPEKGKSLSKEEILRAVSFYTIRKNMSYEIYVVEDYNESGDLSKLGTPVASGKLRERGYHTIEFDEIYLQPGTRFGVVVKLISPDEHPAKMSYEYPSSRAVYARANSDESFISADGVTWSDYTNKVKNANFCIKAFTDNESNGNLALLSAVDNEDREYESDKVYSLEEMIELGAEFNPEYIEYVNSNQNNDLSLLSATSSSSDNGYGAMPPYFNMDTYYNDDNTSIILPEKYDLRELGFVSPVRDQLGYGTCWAFAVYGAMESSLLMRASEEKLAGECVGELTVVQSEGGTLTLDRELAFLNVAINADAIPENGYKFSHLIVNGERVDGTMFTVTTDATVSAVFVKDSLTDTSFEIADSVYQFTINSTTELADKFAVIAFYNDDNKLLSMQYIKDENGSPYIITTAKDENIKYAKVFVWNSSTEMDPFCNFETITVNE